MGNADAIKIARLLIERDEAEKNQRADRCGKIIHYVLQHMNCQIGPVVHIEGAKIQGLGYAVMAMDREEK